MARNALAPHAWTGVLLVASSAVLFAFNGVVSKTALQTGLASTHLVAMRTAGAALILFAAALVMRPEGLRVTRRQAGALAILGVVGVALVQWLYFVAIERLPVGIALLLEYTAPLMVALWARFVFGEQVRRRVWLALALSLIGLTMVAQVGRGASLDAVGIAAALAAAVALATYYLLADRMLEGRDPWSTMAWSMGFAAVFWAILGQPWTIDPALLGSPVVVPETAASLPLWVFVVWIIVLGTAVPYTLIVLGLTRLGAARTGLIGTLEPVLAAAFAWMLMAESMSVLQVLGGAVVLTGVLLAETSRPRATAPVASTSAGAISPPR